MLSIILPCYNEAKNIEALLKRLDQVVASFTDLEILLVNNGSTDETAEIFVHELESRNKSIFKIVNVEKNIGYGFGILSGLRAATGDVLAVTHADRQTDPMDVLKAYQVYTSNSNEMMMVKGYRKNRRFMEAVFSYAMGLLASMALKTRLTEINAQPKLFSQKLFHLIDKDAPHDFALDLFLMYKASKLGIIENIPVYFAKRVAGEAKGGSGSTWKVRYKLIKRIVKYIFEMRNKIRSEQN